MQEERMRLALKIADLHISIDSIYDAYFEEITKEYLCESDSIDVNIRVDKEPEKIHGSTGKKLTDRTIGNWYALEDGVYEYCFYDPGIDALSIKILCDTVKKDIHITLLDVKTLFEFDTKCFLFNTIQRAVNFILIFYNGFEVHASSIVYNNTGLAFSAVSGTGKSTHTGLWLKNYPGTVILNDDKPIMRFVDGEWRIYGTPWAGTTGINQNMCVPLKALVFLERSENNTIRDCVGPEAIKRFFGAVLHPVSDETTNLLLDSLSLLIKHSRICVLGCNMTDDAPETVRKHLYT